MSAQRGVHEMTRERVAELRAEVPRNFFDGPTGPGQRPRHVSDADMLALCDLADEALRTREASAAARERLLKLSDGLPQDTEEVPPPALSPEFYAALAEDES